MSLQPVLAVKKLESDAQLPENGGFSFHRDSQLKFGDFKRLYDYESNP